MQYRINISCEVRFIRWCLYIILYTKVFFDIQGSHLSSLIPIISWYSVSSSEDFIYYENASSEQSHLLTIDYSERGPLEIRVTFSSDVCSKATVIQYNSKSLLDITVITKICSCSQGHSDQC